MRTLENPPASGCYLLYRLDRPAPARARAGHRHHGRRRSCLVTRPSYAPAEELCSGRAGSILSSCSGPLAGERPSGLVTVGGGPWKLQCRKQPSGMKQTEQPEGSGVCVRTIRIGRLNSGVEVNRQQGRATGPPSRCTILIAVAAIGMVALGTDEYAADMEEY